MNIKDKVDVAVECINTIRSMKPEDIQAWVVQEAGLDLAGFFFRYSVDIVVKDPDHLIENAGALMMMGYLVRGHEIRSQQEMFASASSSVAQA